VRGRSLFSETQYEPTVIDLFSGCGGGSIGLMQAGFVAVGAVEIDPNAAASYRLNVGSAPILGDIREVKATDLLSLAGLVRGELTLLVGCPPCQSFTLLRRGSDETAADAVRNRLPNQYLRLVEGLLPRHLAFENVPGMIESPRWRKAFDQLRQKLEALGYRLVWDVVDAADYGVPQHRRRLLLIGSRIAEPRMPTPTHVPDPGEGLMSHRTVRQALAALPKATLASADILHRPRRHRDIAVRRLKALKEGQARADLPRELQLDCHQDHNGHYDIYGRMWWDRPAPTLTSGCTNVTRGRFAHPTAPRAITVREALLLQGFPFDTSLAGGIESMSLQVGNAVPPPLARRIGEAVLAIDRAAAHRSAAG
jgi:DNA (cytosine-5)-methyltransferase 1